MAYSTVFLRIFAMSLFLSLGSTLSEEKNNTEELDVELEYLKMAERARVIAILKEHFGNIGAIPNATKPVNELSHSALPLVLAKPEVNHRSRRSEPPPQQQKHLSELLIYPENVGDFNCTWSNSTWCRRFEYSIEPDAMFNTTEFWALKLASGVSENKTISVFCSQSYENELVIEPDSSKKDRKDNEWIIFHLSLLEQSVWKDKLTCAVEIDGFIVSEEENNLPFLKINRDADTSKNISEEELDKTDTCKILPFNISFAEIGFGAFIVHPEYYEANLCRGLCMKAETFHETLMDLTFRQSPSLEEEHGRCWATCCKPKEYGDLQVVHTESLKERNKKNDIPTMHIVEFFKDMYVKSCSCK